MGWSLAGTLRCLEESFQYFWQWNMKKKKTVIFVIFYKNKWELHQNLKSLMEVVLSETEPVCEKKT